MYMYMLLITYAGQKLQQSIVVVIINPISSYIQQTIYVELKEGHSFLSYKNMMVRDSFLWQELLLFS